MTRRRSGEGHERGGVLCTDPDSAAIATAATASAAAGKRNALLQASTACSCMVLQLLCCSKRAYHRRQVLILSSTTPYPSRMTPALVVAMELRLRCWPGDCGDTNTTGFDRREFGTRALFSFHHFMVLLGVGRRGQRDNEGADSSWCQAPHFCLLVLSAPC